jgi:hypothetical protein
LPVVFETTNSKNIGSVHFVETTKIGAQPYNSKIKSETKVPKVYFISPIVLFAGYFEGDAFSIFVR